MRRQMKSLLSHASKIAGKFRRDERGVTMMVFALSFIPVMLALGVATDYSMGARVKARLQAAADEGALTAVQLASQSQSVRQTAAQNMAVSNLADMTWANVTAVETDLSNGQYQVLATASMPTAFMRLGGWSTVYMTATAVAQTSSSTSSSSTTTITNGSNAVCILALNKTTQGVTFNSGFSVTGPLCEIDVDSTANPAVMFDDGNSAFNLAKICVAGSSVTENNGSITSVSTSCTTAADPFTSSLPAITVPSTPSGCNSNNYSGTSMTPTGTVSGGYTFYCGATFSPSSSSAVITLNPGVYTSNWNFNGCSGGTINLNPGLYVFKNMGGWNVDSAYKFTGTGVTIYFADTSYPQFNAGNTVTLSPPTTGTYANVLMYEASGLSTTGFSFDNGAYTLSGLIHLPSRELTFNSSANVTGTCFTLVVNTLMYDGNSWNISPTCSGGTTTTTTKLVR